MYAEANLANLTKVSGDLFHELETELNLPYGSILNTTAGYIFFGTESAGSTTEGDLTSIQRTCDQLHMDCESLSQAQIQSRFGFGALPGDYKGIFHGGSGYVNYPLLIQGLMTLCRRHGVTMRNYSDVYGLTFPSSADEPLTLATSRASVQTQRVALVPGPYGGHVFMELLGWNLPLILWEMPSVYFAVRDSGLANRIPTWFVFGNTTQELYYGFPGNNIAYPGRVRVAPDFVTANITDPNKRTNVPDPVTVASTVAWVARHMPALDANDYIVDPHTCLASMVQDNLFVLGNAPVQSTKVPAAQRERVSLFTAGWAGKFVPLYGRTLAEVALGLPVTNMTAKDIEDMSPSRAQIQQGYVAPPPPDNDGEVGDGGGLSGVQIAMIIVGTLVGIVVIGAIYKVWQAMSVVTPTNKSSGAPVKSSSVQLPPVVR